MIVDYQVYTENGVSDVRTAKGRARDVRKRIKEEARKEGVLEVRIVDASARDLAGLIKFLDTEV